MPTHKKKPTIIDYRVIGKGRFPMDMLRYDACWPESPTDLDRIMERVETLGTLTESHSEFFHKVRTVHLRSVKAPTVARWRSFGWEVSQS